MAAKVLIAHDAKADQADIDGMVAYLQSQLPNACISTAREQWHLRLSAAGSADQLARDLGGGRGLDGRPLFSLIVFPRSCVGKRNAITAEAALRSGVLVTYLDGVKFVPVRGVECLDPEDWKSGWLLQGAQ